MEILQGRPNQEYNDEEDNYMDMNLLSALEAFETETEAAAAERQKTRVQKIRSKVIEKALQNSNVHIDRETFKKDLGTFLDSLDPEFIADGLNVYFDGPREGAAQYKSMEFDGYTFHLEDSVEGSSRKYTVKVQYAYKRKLPDKAYLKKRLDGFFDKVVHLPEKVTDEAMDAIIEALNSDYTMDVHTCTFQGFMLIAKGGAGKLICLDGKPQDKSHICQAVVSEGVMYVFATGLKLRDDVLTFRLKKVEN